MKPRLTPIKLYCSKTETDWNSTFDEQLYHDGVLAAVCSILQAPLAVCAGTEPPPHLTRHPGDTPGALEERRWGLAGGLWGTAMKQLRIGTDFGWGDGSRGRFATPADFPPQDCSPYQGLHVRRVSLGFAHRSRTIFCRPVPNRAVAIRNCFIAVWGHRAYAWEPTRNDRAPRHSLPRP